ncbi:penicillin-binding protein activator [Seohaeicola saemankumensis]|uniref:penicillin-binding protein activator n=1 Tax=Seohaeicola saemankumensis TaxID=481181 RepID=UPI001E3C0E3F|nr:penicillin-binding protein activator [Seohaeicola saemankumensis]MCD1627194.1 penicillin-binding protein activator [Seohaeicola saemankumensis]
MFAFLLPARKALGHVGRECLSSALARLAPAIRPLQSSRRGVFTIAALGALAACEPIDTSLDRAAPAIDNSAPVAVALLVPRGSANASDEVLARALENAARLAIADLGDVAIDLRVYGTAGSAATAQQVALQAVSDGAKIILGPVYAENANAAAVVVASSGVNVLAFSNNTSIAGGNLFILGPTFDNTADRLTRYAVRQNKGRTVVVYSEDVAGRAGLAAIEGALARNGGTAVGAISHEFSQNGVMQAVPQIVSAVRSGSAESIFMTADTAGALPLLTQLLPEAGVSPATTQYIGLTRWDIPSQTTDLPGVQGGWFALPDPEMSARFRSRYSAAYGESPHPIGGLAYDGIAAIGALVSSGRSDALSRASLTQSAGFQGVNGIFRLRTDGTNERGLAVAQIRDRQVVVIDPAPRAFGGAGF